MKSRLIISLLCTGAVAFACGPRARNDNSGAAASGTTLASARTVSQQGAPRSTRTSSKGPISAALDVKHDATSIHLALEVVNTSKKSIELTFPSGQTHDFVILDSLDREVWRWGTGRLFTQALKNKRLSRGETLSMTETWNSPTLKAGRYRAIAVLKSENYPLREETSFSVGGATLAVRE